MKTVFPALCFPAPSFIHAVLLFFSLCLCSSVSLAHPDRFHLDVSFQPEENRMQGVATITFHPGEEWQLHTGNLSIHEIILEEEGEKPISMPLPKGETISMYGSDSSQKLTIHYSLTLKADATGNLISPRGIVLTSNWHPLPQREMIFSLDATLPQGFLGISESDDVPEQEGNRMSSSFSQPVRSIHLAAGPYQVEEMEVRDGLNLSTWFFSEERQLSRGYLDAAKAYILRYEKELGPFPYKHYAIVSNRLASGFGMPTFTLLGQMVLRLPFIKETSLGHEIIHSWFGNSIEVADHSGNWCEGLTTYLGDYSFATDKGKGAAHRKGGLINYTSYAHPDTSIPLWGFRSASHNQPMAKAIRAVGYNRGAMFFHQLRGLIGPESFYQGLRDMAASYQGRAATWQDIQNVFEDSSGKELGTFFKEQLTREDVPVLAVKDIRTEDRQDSSILHFTIEQKSEQPYLLNVPIRVNGVEGEQHFTREITEKETRVSLTLTEPPLSFTIDPEYDLFRELSPTELSPVWSRFLGAKQKLLILTGKQAKRNLAPFIEWAENQGWPVVDEDSVTNQQLSENALLFLGAGGGSFRSLFGQAHPPGEGFTLSVRNHPLNEKEVAVLLTSSSSQETEAVLHKLKHYGKYSTLSFQKGRIRVKEITATENGIHRQLASLPRGGATSSINSFEHIITELAQNRVIYLGERHDSLADHLLQLRIIQELQRRGIDLAVAMEMFPRSSQPELDSYVLKEKEMDESSFLRKSRWFEVWRHDWRLFRPIFNYCRRQKIPIHGINIEREIVSTVFADGNTDGLSHEQLEDIAPERDLDLEGYVERLRVVHGFHAQSPETSGKGIAGFVQSQAIWDESMAESIVTILKDNPEKTVVVIAGSQHTRKDSGIPPRVLRRMDVEQASVLNLYESSPPSDPGQQADYFFMAEGGSLEAKGKIGVILNPEKDEKGTPRLRISGISHGAKAGTAGLKENDIILSIGGSPVQDMGDIGILMMDSRAGDTLQLTIQREDENGDPLEVEITVELSNLTKPPGHP